MLTEAGAGIGQVWVSHLTADELARLRAAYPGLRVRPRIGTDLWLGDRSALSVTSTVLDVHPVAKGEAFGYRGRSAPKDGHLLVVSGGTAHGIGLESPMSGSGLRDRAATVARGGLDAAGRVRSPFWVDGEQRLFAEPPHMQASMLFLPGGRRGPGGGRRASTRGSATPRRRSTGSSCPDPVGGRDVAHRQRGHVHRVLPRPPDVARDHRAEVELGRDPDRDREPVEAGVLAAARREVAVEVPPHRREVEDLAALPDDLVAPPRPGQHRQRQQPQDVLR